MGAAEVLQDQTNLQDLLDEMAQGDSFVNDEAVQAGRLLWAMGLEIKRYADRTDEAATADYVEALNSVRRLPVKPAVAIKLDQDLLDICLDVLRDPNCSIKEKQAIEAMSLNLGADQLGATKGETLRQKYQASKGEERRSVEVYLDIADIKLADLRRPVKLQAHLDRAATVLKQLSEVPKQRARTAALIGVLGISGLSASPAYADSSTTPEISVTAGLGTIPSSDMLLATQAAANADSSPLNTVLVKPGLGPAAAPKATIEAETPTNVTVRAGVPAGVKLPDTSPSRLAASQAPAAAQIKVKAGLSATVSLPATAEAPSNSKTAVDSVNGQPSAPPVPEAVTVAPTIPDKVILPAPSETSGPLTIPVPDSNVNQAPNETPQQTIERLAQTQDIAATSYAIRKLYGVNGVDQKPVNDQLVTAVGTMIDTTKQQIIAAKHDDTYTNKALLALAYLDAAAKDPTVLDNSDVAAFLNGLGDLGEDYHNRIYAPYLTDAGNKLTSKDFGALNGIDAKYQPMLEDAYAYSSLAGVSNADQNKQIQAIKDAEAAAAKKAADEAAAKQAADAAAAKQQADQLAQQGLTPIEITAANPEQLLQTAIDRAAAANGWAAPKTTLIKVFAQNGASLAAVAGEAGNAAAESGFNPGIEERTSRPQKGFGFFQWTFARRTALEAAAAAAKGVSVADPAFQAQYAINESQGRVMRGDEQKPKDQQRNEWAEFIKITDPAAAADFWRWNFERPNAHLAHSDFRVTTAQQIYDQINSQIGAINTEAANAATARVAAAQKAAADAAAQQAAQEAAQAAKQLDNGQGNVLLAMYADESSNSEYKMSYNEIDNSQCVSFVEFVLMKYSQDHPDNNFFRYLGNGMDVAATLGERGYTVDHTPSPLSVVSLPNGFHTGVFNKNGTEFVTNSEFGHTGVVISVASNGDIVMAQTGAANGVHYKYLTTIKADKAAQLTYAHTENDLAGILSDPAMQGK